MGYLSKLTLTFKNVWADVSVRAEVWFGQFFFFHSTLPIPRRDAALKWNKKKNAKHTYTNPSYCLIEIMIPPSPHLHLTALTTVAADHRMKAIGHNSNA